MSMATPIKSTLTALPVGGKAQFPISRRKSVRTTASDLKKDEGYLYKTGEENGVLIVERKK